MILDVIKKCTVLRKREPKAWNFNNNAGVTYKVMLQSEDRNGEIEVDPEFKVPREIYEQLEKGHTYDFHLSLFPVKDSFMCRIVKVVEVNE